MSKVVLSVVAVSILLAGCVSNTRVTFDSNAPNAEVFVDGRFIGTTPATTLLSNAVWKDPAIRIEADGYRTYLGSVDKELKVANGVFGLLLWWPSLLYVWGPESAQYFELRAE